MFTVLKLRKMRVYGGNYRQKDGGMGGQVNEEGLSDLYSCIRFRAGNLGEKGSKWKKRSTKIVEIRDREVTGHPNPYRKKKWKKGKNSKMVGKSIERS